MPNKVVYILNSMVLCTNKNSLSQITNNPGRKVDSKSEEAN